MDASARAVADFRASVARPDRLIDRVDSALLAARIECPDLDGARARKELAEMGITAGKRCRGGALDRLRGLNELLYDTLGFHGNTDEYYDPRNSCLNEVIDRRTGIPITLALVYIEVAKGAGLDLCGVGLPGHFLVGVRQAEVTGAPEGTRDSQGLRDSQDVRDSQDLRESHDLDAAQPPVADIAATRPPEINGVRGPWIDVFSRGRFLGREDCLRMFEMTHPDTEFRQEFLAPVGPRPFLSRLLNNLFGIYADSGQWVKAAPIVEMMMAVNGSDAELLRRRVLVARELGHYGRAVRDLQRYLTLRPDAPDTVALHQQLELLARLRNTIN